MFRELRTVVQSSFVFHGEFSCALQGVKITEFSGVRLGVKNSRAEFSCVRWGVKDSRADLCAQCRAESVRSAGLRLCRTQPVHSAELSQCTVQS